ncbi:hypothetical protein J2Q11_10940 [Tenacibaculum finnmarkense genomovar finnmarkense]|uniref:hypothetical protein n=1 Tax=Tenacibaculum finnmarkense TaxID=2781243 RepID=UPI001E481F4F|nr:hypothetical protein [Tenacibaculum finnmarkense]MCD8418625.1 hypothetical protein [Tenacibaculum finnmarkense genomovar finnmarkense]MCG8186560.1 hypothetical protein [Tenacibaculum finnmarkense genomovar finnmarkense]MCG8203097.1 hypothetical protein [Tenacibaculum finnmarkense genomovar finnmarkense]MCG8210475.1 hypothetical protein [Tenacibaculum finnmarkense genomovar finnmarkense]MCG8213328.1 hypothetical protein [Tenacibaculum finnmarkense genomovar finnmarkense]
MESKLNIYGLAGVPGRGRGVFMDGNGKERFGRPISRRPIIKLRPKTRQSTKRLVKTTGGFKPAKIKVKPFRPKGSKKPIFIVTSKPNIDDVESGKIKYNKDVKKFVIVNNKAEENAIKLAFENKLKKDQARTLAARAAKSKAKKLALANAKRIADDKLKRVVTGGFKPPKPIIQTVVPENVPMNLSTETTETEEKETFISKNKYAIGVAGLVTAGLLFFRKKDDKKKT